MTAMVIDTTTTTSISTAEKEGLLSPNSLIQQYRSDDRQEQQLYRDSCQQVLNDISNVKSLVKDLKETKDIYYPSTATTLSVLKIDNNENNELYDSSARLLNDKLSSCVQHLEKLNTRVSDTSSKVLVTGDLNSGKSTLVNALLKREILPVDQQPCTSIFCEVLSTTTTTTTDVSDTVVHAIKDIASYDEQNDTTYHALEARHLYNVLTEEEQPYKMLKIYSPRDLTITQDSLLHNGLIDIALIDSPGLNTDSIKTTAVFAREEEIDVVVFVVSAENHFTLSGKEFLWNAANEKTHIFIVVNRFDNIRDKERCKRLILEQIKQLSPATYDRADDLVHFVSAGHQVNAPDFIKLEQKLRSFVLHNRMGSKLSPAKNYLANVLRDLYFISTVNESKSEETLNTCIHNLQYNFLPGYSTLINVKNTLQRDLQELKETSMKAIEQKTSSSLYACTSDKVLDASIQSIQYPGLFLSWQYAQDIADSLSSKLQNDLRTVESNAREDTIASLKEMNTMTLDTLRACGDMDDITTKIHDDVLRSTTHNRPIHINVQARDFLLDRKIVDDKKIALSGLATVSATTMFFKAINLKDIALNVISRYLNPLDDSTAALPSRRFIAYTLTTVGVLSAGWTAYSFISVIPQAIQNNLKQKFQTAVHHQKFAQTHTHRLIQSADQVLEAKKNEIVYRLKEVIAEKETEKSEIENDVLQAKAALHHFRALVTKSDALLIKVQEASLAV